MRSRINLRRRLVNELLPRFRTIILNSLSMPKEQISRDWGLPRTKGTERIGKNHSTGSDIGRCLVAKSLRSRSRVKESLPVLRCTRKFSLVQTFRNEALTGTIISSDQQHWLLSSLPHSVPGMDFHNATYTDEPRQFFAYAIEYLSY